METAGKASVSKRGITPFQRRFEALFLRNTIKFQGFWSQMGHGIMLERHLLQQ
jgi:hypothetical protein